VKQLQLLQDIFHHVFHLSLFVRHHCLDRLSIAIKPICISFNVTFSNMSLTFLALSSHAAIIGLTPLAESSSSRL
jgi:hypothetical protein